MLPLTMLILLYFSHIFIVDGNWGAFGEWNRCSVTCGRGLQARDRLCDNPAPANGGKPCAGSSYETRDCNEKKCPG